jgi:hypothetical protein
MENSESNPGRPAITREIRNLIRLTRRENGLGCGPRSHGRSTKARHQYGTCVSKNLVRSGNPPSQTWRTFLENHPEPYIRGLLNRTAPFRFLYVFPVPAHDRRRASISR